MPKFVRDWMFYMINRKQKQIHYGQVVPIEGVEKIFELTNSIVRVACYCRYNTIGKEKRYCYGIRLTPETGMAEIVKGLSDSFKTGLFTVRGSRDLPARKHWKPSANMRVRGFATWCGRLRRRLSEACAIVTVRTAGRCGSL